MFSLINLSFFVLLTLHGRTLPCVMQRACMQSLLMIKLQTSSYIAMMCGFGDVFQVIDRVASW